jgi:CHAT domain-containing protein
MNRVKLFALMLFITSLAHAQKETKNPHYQRRDIKEIQILKVTQTSDSTFVDFRFSSPNASWICAGNEFFIRDVQSQKSYKSLRYKGVVICPQHYNFKSNEIIDFQISFEPIPYNTSEIDIIENENQRSFNFYNVDLTKSYEDVFNPISWAEEIISCADSLTEIEQYEQVIALLENNKDYVLNSGIIIDSLNYNYYMGFAYLSTHKLDKAESHLTTCSSMVESTYGKYSVENEDLMRLLIKLYTEYRNIDKLLISCLSCLEIIETIYGKDCEECLQLRYVLGKLYTNNNDEKARDIFLELKNAIENKSQIDTLLYANVNYMIGRIDYYHDNFEIAEKYLNNAKEIFEDYNHIYTASYIDVLTKLANVCDYYTGNNEKAEQYYIKAIKIARQTNNVDSLNIAKLLVQVASVYQKTENYQKAEETLIEAKNIQQTLNNTGYYAAILGYLGNLYQKSNNYLLAKKYLHESAEIQKFVSDSSFQYADALFDLADFYRDIGDSILTFEYLNKSLIIQENLYALAKSDSDPIWSFGMMKHYAATLESAGGIYGGFGNDSIRWKYLKEAEKIYEENLGKEHLDYIDFLSGLGVVYLTHHKLDEAETTLLEADSLYVKVFGEKSPHRSFTLLSLGIMYSNFQENYDLGLKCFLEMKNILETYGEKTLNEYCPVFKSLFYIYCDIEQYDKVFRDMNEWNILFMSEVQKNFMFMSEKQRNSFLYNKESLSPERFIKTYLTYYNTPASQSLAYNNTLFAKGLLLRSTNEIRDAILNSGNQNLINQFEDLHALRQQIITLQAKTDNYEKEYIESLEHRADSLDKVLTIASSAYREQKADLNMEWKDIQNKLSDNEIAIEFIDYQKINKERADTTMYAALIMRKDYESPIFVPLFEQSQLDSLLSTENNSDKSFVENLYSRAYIVTENNAPNFRNGQKLYDLIWKPIEKYLDGVKTIYYSPSGTLNQIAFSALPVDSTTLLADKYDLHLVSSTREIVLNQMNPQKTEKNQAAVYGGIIYDAQPQDLLAATQRYSSFERNSGYFVSDSTLQNNYQLNYLKGTKEEVEKISQIMDKDGISKEVYLGLDASEESFKQLSGKNMNIIHLATHGFFFPVEEIERKDFSPMRLGEEQRITLAQNPLMRSGLLMAGANRVWTGKEPIEGLDDGILTAHEISQMDLSKTDLVVLSACETGLGDIKGSEGVFGLQRAFKLAGVKTIIMSLWKVPDEQTSQLMQVFYKNWLDGKSKHEAFKTAQKEVREKYPNPYYWAAFVMLDD